MSGGERPSDAFAGLAKQCRHCGALAQTLGTECPACGRSYRELSLIDRLPDFDATLVGAVGGAGALVARGCRRPPTDTAAAAERLIEVRSPG